MGLLTPGVFPSTAFPSSVWVDGVWAEFGEVFIRDHIAIRWFLMLNLKTRFW